MKSNDIQTIIINISGKCPICSSAPSETCFYHNGACFYRQCGNYNWYEARSKCQQLGMHLSVSVMESGLQSWLNAQACMKVWLGYSKEEWHYISPSTGKHLHTVHLVPIVTLSDTNVLK